MNIKSAESPPKNAVQRLCQVTVLGLGVSTFFTLVPETGRAELRPGSIEERVAVKQLPGSFPAVFPVASYPGDSPQRDASGETSSGSDGVSGILVWFGLGLLALVGIGSYAERPRKGRATDTDETRQP